MTVTLSIKNVPDDLAARLRERAERNHRSLQGELMAILENAAGEPNVARVRAGDPRYEARQPPSAAESLMDRLTAIAGSRGIDSTKRLAREQAHDRRQLRKSGV